MTKKGFAMSHINVDSTIKDVWETPVGHDVLKKLLITLNLPESTVTNPVSAHVKISSLSKVFGDKVPPTFLMSLIHLINSEPDTPRGEDEPEKKAWWKEAVFYQIYPRSFRDSNGDGIGDIKGIIEKLDYLKDLGINAIWLSPVYDSPNDDNGYDIRDYRKIMKEFGTMEDFDTLLSEMHKRDIKLLMDLVVNHTSDEHEWFQTALKDPKSKYRDYYFFREAKEGDPLPNNWNSFFSGPAWDRYPLEPIVGEDKRPYALHLFSKKQPDLNWDNPELREDVIDMIKFWLEKGVDGFRMDVINYISKVEGLPDGDETIAEMMGFPGIEKYYYGPNLHKYFKQIHEEAFKPYNAFSVGECPGLGMQMAKLVTGDDRGELDMMFSFDHLENPGKGKFDDYKYDLNYYRDYMIDWMENYGNRCRMSLFYNNHDNPRMVSKINPKTSKDAVLRQRLEILLVTMQMTLKGTPFIFQGDEMGLTNYNFKSMEDIRDIESKNLYKELINQGKTEKEAFKIIKAGSRDHAREPLPWADKETKRPEHLKQTPDPAILNAYRDLIKIRKENEALIYGEFKLLNKDKDHFTYARKYKDEIFVIDINLSDKKIPSVFRREDFTPVFMPHFLESGMNRLSPYEARIFKKERR